VATPHQLGVFSQNRGEEIRALVAELNDRLVAEAIPVAVLAGGEVRIEPGLLDGLVSGELVTLGDHRRHLLLELPHELYLPVDSLMSELAARRIAIILAHPERNEGILRQPQLAGELVDAGCLMQITAGSLCGSMGSRFQETAEWLVNEGLVHLVATDGHGPRTRRPMMGRAHDRLLELTDLQTADDLCCRNPARVAAGRSIAAGRRAIPRRARRSWWSAKASA
jgi:protein-tyrosine phosphatase